MAFARDGCVVSTEPLAQLLNTFASRWRIDRPSTAGRFSSSHARTDVPFVSPVDWLVAETKQQDPDGLGVSESQIDRIMGRRSTVTELRTADHLVGALGRPEMFHDGTLEIRPNPLATPQEQAACCGGSLTGGLTDGFWTQLACCVAPNPAA